MKHIANEPAPVPTYDDLRAVIRQLHDASEVRSIAMHRALHDEMGGLIVSAAMDLSALVLQSGANASITARLRRAQRSIMAAVDLKRRLSEELRPSLLDNLGLFAAIRWHIKHDCAHSSAVCSEQYPDAEMQLTAAATTALYRIAQESLALVFAEPDLKAMQFEIKVDNAGLQMALAHEHTGGEPIDLFHHAPAQMFSLAERTNSLEGEMRVGRSEVGTLVVARFPLERVLAS